MKKFKFILTIFLLLIIYLYVSYITLIPDNIFLLNQEKIKFRSMPAIEILETTMTSLNNSNITNLELTSLKNAPKVVDGIFSIEGCSNIKSLKHCPETVNTLVINRTGVTDISELDKVTLKNLYAINTPLDESTFDALKNKTKIMKP